MQQGEAVDKYLEDFESRPVANLRTEQKALLKQANKEWSDCFSQQFLPQWLAGKSLQANEVCADQYAKMIEADSEVYGKFKYSTAEWSRTLLITFKQEKDLKIAMLMIFTI